MASALTRLGVIAALASTLVATGCSTSTAGTAAVVDGQRISEDDVQVATAQLAKLIGPQDAPDANKVLSYLIVGPTLLADAQAAGVNQSFSAMKSQLSSSMDPADSTVRYAQIITSLGGMTQPQRAATLHKIQSLDVSVNPKYGAWDPTKVEIAPTRPTWISPAK